jgi:hypothetical protein
MAEPLFDLTNGASNQGFCLTSQLLFTLLAPECVPVSLSCRFGQGTPLQRLQR